MGDFAERVFAVVRRIPRGRVASYGQVARIIGAPRSARYVGYALRANPSPGADAADIPCHRVVFKDGGLCEGFAFGGPGIQRALLEGEGVIFADEGRVDMDACAWAGPEGTGGTGGTGGENPGGPLPAAPPPGFDWKQELGP